MLLWFINFLSYFYPGFNVFYSPILRAFVATLTAFLIILLLGPSTIRLLSRYQCDQPIRPDGPAQHKRKAGTPTMGGILILLSVIITTLLWADLKNVRIWIALFAMFGFGLIGFADDYLKLILKNSRGLPARWKYFWQSLLGFTIAYLAHRVSMNNMELSIPFFKNLNINLGIFYIPFAYCVIVGSSNAVNLTDGLDGLAIFPTVLVAGALSIFAYLMGNAIYAHYLMLPFISNASELTLVCAALVGSGLGFLWFNSYPAQVFMGDVASLGLGAILGSIAVMIHLVYFY